MKQWTRKRTEEELIEEFALTTIHNLYSKDKLDKPTTDEVFGEIYMIVRKFRDHDVFPTVLGGL